MSGPARRILLGHIAGVHGVRGELVIKSYTDDPAAIASYGPLADEAGTRRFTMRVVRVTPKGVIARIEGVGDRNTAEALKRTSLWVARDRLPPAQDGSFYHADLVGLTAVDPNGRDIGEVLSVQNYGAGDLLELRLEGQRHSELIPFQNAYVPKVDLVAGQVIIIMPTSTGDTEEDGEGDS